MAGDAAPAAELELVVLSELALELGLAVVRLEGDGLRLAAGELPTAVETVSSSTVAVVLSAEIVNPPISALVIALTRLPAKLVVNAALVCVTDAAVDAVPSSSKANVYATSTPLVDVM